MATPGTEIVELETGVFARLHEGLTNAGIIVGDDSVLIIDSLRVPSFARDLIKDVKDITDKPIKFVIDTHSHWDHSWGNQEFPEAAIIGHENCYTEMIDVEWNHEQLKDKIDIVQSYANLFHITAWLYLDENPKREKNLEKICQDVFGINLVRFREDANKFKFKS